MQTALQEFPLRARRSEKLRDFLLQRVEKIEMLRNSVMPMSAAIALMSKSWRPAARGDAKCPAQDAGTLGISDERVRQEITLFATRITWMRTVALASHSRMRRILARGAAGKRLDFLMQELTVSNTLGSKSGCGSIAQRDGDEDTHRTDARTNSKPGVNDVGNLFIISAPSRRGKTSWCTHCSTSIRSLIYRFLHHARTASGRA